jgi:hypothetical protein
MSKVLNFLKKNIFGTACVIYAAGYLIFRFETLENAVLFLLVMVFFYSSLFFCLEFFRRVIYDEAVVSVVLNKSRSKILLFAGTSFAIFLLAGWKFLSAFLLGISAFTVFSALLFLFKRKRQ